MLMPAILPPTLVESCPMTDYWLTTHWPSPEIDPPSSRHVYIKEGWGNLPKPGALVFIRQTIYVTDRKGRRIRTADRHYRGKITRGLKLPVGSGGIIGTAIVHGKPRAIGERDVVFDYGDLREWSVIPCRDFRPAKLRLDDLRVILNRDNMRGLKLWRMSDEVGSRLLKALRRLNRNGIQRPPER